MQNLENQLLPFLSYQQRITLQPLIRVFFQEEVFLYLACTCNSLHQIAMHKAVSDCRLIPGSGKTCLSMEVEDVGGRGDEAGRKECAMGRCINQGPGIRNLV